MNESQKWMFGLVQPFLKNGGAAPAVGAPMPFASTPGGILYGPGQYQANGAIVGNTLDATGELQCVIGRVRLQPGASGSKTISAAGGGSISFRTATVTFADGASTFEIGLQDISTTTGPPARPDGTYDVSRVLTGGGGALASNTSYTLSMTGGTGSKTLADNDLICVVFTFTNRAGADSVIISGSISSQGYEGGSTAFLGGSWSAGGISSNIVITFDDGTFGFVEGSCTFPWANQNTESFIDTTNPDERGLIFQVPWDCKINGICGSFGGEGSQADVTLTLYSDPLGTPTSLFTRNILGENLSQTFVNIQMIVPLGTTLELDRNTDYCIALKSNGANNARINVYTLGNAGHRVFYPGGTTLRKGARNNSSGAFAETTTIVPCFGIRICELHESGS